MESASQQAIVQPTVPPSPTKSLPSNNSEGSGSTGSPFQTPVSSPLIETSSPPTSTADHESDSKESATPDLTTLTPLRAHYLKKELVRLQLQRELDALISAPTNSVSTFSYLGPPFTSPPKDAPKLELPLLTFWFRRFVLTFPFLAAAPKDFFPVKLQPFMISMLSRNLSPTSVLDDDSEDAESASRTKLVMKLERNMAMLTTSGTKIVEKEEVVRLSQADLNRLEKIAAKRIARERKMKDLFDVNVVCVRTVTEKKRMRSRLHEEFIIRTRRGHQSDIFVSRRYGDFRTLADELRKAHPAELIPQPPAKDRSYVNVNLTSPDGSPPSSVPRTTPTATSPTNTSMRARMATLYEQDTNSSADSFSTQPPMSPAESSTSGAGHAAARLSREKNRLTLRSYLHSLLSSSTFANSPVLKSFLLSGPTRLTSEEVEDARRREEADKVREDGRKRFAQEIAARVDGLRDAAKSVKGELFAKDGLTRVFATIKQTEDVRNLPENYQAVVEWARISVASTVFHHFVAADDASESFAGLKRIHGMMPYFMLKAALKISNPMAMIRGVLDLFLAQPFGGRSLLQRMFTGSLMEEVKALEEDIEAIKDRIGDDTICEKVRLFVYAPPEIQAVYKADAAAENIHILSAVLRSGEEPRLSRQQLQRVLYAHRAHKEYVKHAATLADSDDDEGPEDEEAWLFEDLSILTKLYSRLRDRQQLIELIFEGTTADLLKDIITIFYAPLAQVYRAASIADSLGDLQNFINDLIKTVESCDDTSQLEPAQTVQMFVDLIQRHEQSFYSFVHKVHSKGENLFNDLMRWIELFLTLLRDGIGEPLSLEWVLPHRGPDREEIIQEVDQVALYHYKLKVAYEDKVRRRFGRTQGLNDADAEDEMAAELVNGVVKDLSFGELVQGDADDLAAQETDEDDDSSSFEESSSSSGTDSESDSDDGDDSEDDNDEGNSTERPPPVPAKSQLPGSPMARSRTIHVQSPRLSPGSRQTNSMDLGRPPMIPRRSRTISAPQKPNLSLKDLPPVPTTAPLQQRSPSRARAGKISPQRKRKVPEIKPPELKRIPNLLPVFMEMMRPQLRS